MSWRRRCRALLALAAAGASQSFLLGLEVEGLVERAGKHWVRRGERLALSVEDCLAWISGFDALAHEESRRARQRAYAARGVLSDANEVAGARARRIWSGGPMKFWSVAICRTEDGALEKIEDHKFVARLLQKCPLSADLEGGENWTFIFNKVHAATAEMQELHHALWACFGVSGDFNVYLTPPNAQGLAPHADPHDVLVVQQAGEKTWSLLEADQVTVAKNVTLSPGDVLYLPQGVPHVARSAGGSSSLHVTMSVYRGHFTYSNLLAAWATWLEVGAGTREVFDQSLASRIDAVQARLAGKESGKDPLPPSFLPLLRAFDAEDVPETIAREAMAGTLRYAQDLKLDEVEKLRSLELSSFTEAVMAARQLRWIKHYRLYGSKHLTPEEGSVRSDSGNFKRVKDMPLKPLLRRAADAAAMRTQSGDLLLNGFLIQDLPADREALRFCLGRYSGSAGQAFRLDEIPGASGASGARALAQVLLHFGGLEFVG